MALIEKVKLTQDIDEAQVVALSLKVGPSGLEILSMTLILCNIKGKSYLTPPKV